MCELTEKQSRLLTILRNRRRRWRGSGLSFMCLEVEHPLHSICQELEVLDKIKGFCVSTDYNVYGVIVPSRYDWQALESA